MEKPTSILYTYLNLPIALLSFTSLIKLLFFTICLLKFFYVTKSKARVRLEMAFLFFSIFAKQPFLFQPISGDRNYLPSDAKKHLD